ncbi:phosphotriesterase-family protein [Kutzneria viridogrisea]|uniref:Phosphotriesterase-related protein n=1 Tax=Kutzneria viridogrisea TaxID=47990 RepID=A0ABR6BJQ2_9PSEU|nr:phosphotriesterase-related protein [Kutzneria viridogrisea]
MIRTVLGDIAPEELGVCDSHDHLFFRSELLPGQELDDVAAAEAELRAFGAAGGQALVQWTPAGLGRRRDALAELSRATGVAVVAATGLHQAAHYAPDRLGGLVDRLTEISVGDLTSGIRAGMIKVAGQFHHLDAHAERVMTAAAQAHHETGAPIGVHLELGTAPLEVLDLLCAKHGVPPNRVILGHLNRFPEQRVHRAAAEAGAFLAFDGPSRANHATDWRLFDVLTSLVESGHGGQVLLGGDTTTAAARASTGGGPGIPYLLTSLRPRLSRELGKEAVTSMFVANPARAFSVPWRR